MVSSECFIEGRVDHEELQSQFLQFQKATKELQEAYRSLKERASSVDQELAQTNRALRVRLEERERILESMPLGVFHQRNEKVEAGNEEGQRLQKYLGPQFLEMLTGLPPGKGVSRLNPKSLDGNPCFLEVTSLDLGGSGHEVLHFVVNQTEVLSLQAEVSRLDRIEGLATLALGVAHEIRNPLNGVGGYASLLRRNPTSPKVGDWAEKIEGGVRRVENIIRDLLAFARPEKRGVPRCKSLRDWLNQVEEELPFTLCKEDGEVLVEGDEIAFPAVLKNLFRNAKEAGASRVLIQVESSDDGYCYIRIEDDGKGLPSGWKERIFDPFVSDKVSGTGLGLAFCRKALESMGGEIRALNEGCAGAKFELRVKVGRRGMNG